MTIYEVIRCIRKATDMSCTEFAASIGVSAAAVYNYENDLRRPRHPTVQKLLNVSDKHNLGFTIEDFYPRNK